MELVPVSNSRSRLLAPGDDAELGQKPAIGSGTDGSRGNGDAAPPWDSQQNSRGPDGTPPSFKLAFRNIVYSVKPRRRGSERLTILDNVSGHCRSGRVLAVRTIDWLLRQTVRQQHVGPELHDTSCDCCC